MITDILIEKLLAVVITLTTALTTTVVPAISNLQQEVNQLQQCVCTQETAGDIADIMFGGFTPAGAGRYQLAGSGISSSASSIVLKSLTDLISGYELNMNHFGEIGYATIEPGSSSKREFVSFTGITQNAGNTEATLTGVTRGLSPYSPYTASTTQAQSHSGGSVVIFSNSPAFYDEFAALKNDESIAGTWTFDDSYYPQMDGTTIAPSQDEDLATKKYVDDVAIAGAADATVSVKGLIEIGTWLDIAKGAAASSSDTSATLVAASSMFSSSTQATTTVPVTRSSGKLAQGFIDLTEAFTWSAAHTFTSTVQLATTTITGNLIINRNATTTEKLYVGKELEVAGTSTFSGIPTLPAWDPSTANQAVRKSYVDTFDRNFTAWEERTVNTVYTATTSGFVMAFVDNDASGSSNGWANLVGETPASFTRIIDGYGHYGASAIFQDAGFMMPVINGNTWRITTSTNAGSPQMGTTTVYWLTFE